MKWLKKSAPRIGCGTSATTKTKGKFSRKPNVCTRKRCNAPLREDHEPHALWLAAVYPVRHKFEKTWAVVRGRVC